MPSPSLSATHTDLPPHLQRRLRRTAAIAASATTESQLRRKLEQATARRAHHLSRSIHMCRLTLTRVRQRQHATRQRAHAAAARLGHRLAAADRNRARSDRSKAERARGFTLRFGVGAAVWMRDFYSGYPAAAATVSAAVASPALAHNNGRRRSPVGRAGRSVACVEPQHAARVLCRVLRHYTASRVLQREFPYLLEPWMPPASTKTGSRANAACVTAQDTFGPNNTLECYEAMAAFIRAPPPNLVRALNLLFLTSASETGPEESNALPQGTNSCSLAGQYYPRLLLSAFLVAHNSGMLGVHPAALHQARVVGTALTHLVMPTDNTPSVISSIINRNRPNGTNRINNENNDNDFSLTRSSCSVVPPFSHGALIELEGELLKFGRLVDQDHQVAVRHMAQALVENAELAESYCRRSTNNSTHNHIATTPASRSNPSSSKNKDSKLIMASVSTKPVGSNNQELISTGLSERTAQTIALRRRAFAQFPDYTALERFSLEMDIYPGLQLLAPPGPAAETTTKTVGSEEIVDRFSIDALIRGCAFELSLDPEYRLAPVQLPAFARFQRAYAAAGFRRQPSTDKENSPLNVETPAVDCDWFVEAMCAVTELFCLIRTPATVIATLPCEARVRQLLLASNYDHSAVLAQIYPQYAALAGSSAAGESDGGQDEPLQSPIEQFVYRLAQQVCTEWNRKLLAVEPTRLHLVTKLARTEPQRIAELIKTGKVVIGDDDELLEALALGNGGIARQWRGEERVRALEALRKLYMFD